ncbi:MAG: helix-turn-helix domain-containing protein [Phycisphaerales bacterium]|jgi:predicted DNA-binding transcriptional regulator AlpA
METGLNMANDRLIGQRQVEQMLAVSPRTVSRLRTMGEIPAPVSLGGSVRWRLADIIEFINADCDMAKFKAKKETEQ